jgi:hypothetical protein
MHAALGCLLIWWQVLAVKIAARLFEVHRHYRAELEQSHLIQALQPSQPPTLRDARSAAISSNQPDSAPDRIEVVAHNSSAPQANKDSKLDGNEMI